MDISVPIPVGTFSLNVDPTGFFSAVLVDSLGNTSEFAANMTGSPSSVIRYGIFPVDNTAFWARFEGSSDPGASMTACMANVEVTDISDCELTFAATADGDGEWNVTGDFSGITGVLNSTFYISVRDDSDPTTWAGSGKVIWIDTNLDNGGAPHANTCTAGTIDLNACTMRDAIDSASGGETIIFDGGQFSTVSTGTITLVDDFPVIAVDDLDILTANGISADFTLPIYFLPLSIDADGHEGIVISGDDNYLTGLEISGTANAGLEITGSGNRIGDECTAVVRVFEAGGDGVWVHGPGATANAIEMIYVADSGARGFVLEDSADNNIIGVDECYGFDVSGSANEGVYVDNVSGTDVGVMSLDDAAAGGDPAIRLIDVTDFAPGVGFVENSTAGDVVVTGASSGVDFSNVLFNSSFAAAGTIPFDLGDDGYAGSSDPSSPNNYISAPTVVDLEPTGPSA
ncbi:MAG: hypothetical protein KC561_09275, partial [Myxococcales bacterium]|nr:hypothetical protein [Myxococcales bacterium]